MDNLYYVTYQATMILSLVISLSVAALMFQRRTYPAAASMIALSLASFVWTLGYLLESHTTTLLQHSYCTSIGYLGSMALPVAWLVFSVNYVSGRQLITPRYWILLSIVPLVITVLIWTNSFHNLMWANERLILSGPFLTTAKDYGPFFWVALGYNYLLILIGAAVLFSRLFIQTPLFKRQAIALAVAAVLPLLWNIIFIFRVFDLPRKDLTPAMFAFSGFIIAIGVLRLHLFTVVPYAHRMVFQTLNDPAFIFNNDNHLMDINPAAMSIAGVGNTAIGEPIDTLRGVSPVFGHLSRREELPAEMMLDTVDGSHIFETFIIPLANNRGQDTGWMAVLHDITTRKDSARALQTALDESRAHASETLAFLAATRAILEVPGFRGAAASIYDSCCARTGATAGYVGALESNGEEYIVLYASGQSHDLPGPIMAKMAIGTGCREACRLGKSVIYNSFPSSPDAGMLPQEHFRLDNIMYTPITLDNKSVGVISLANKPGGFVESDARFVESLAEIAALALVHNRSRDSLKSAYEQERELRQSLENESQKRMKFSRALVHELKTPLTPILATSEIMSSEIKGEPWQSMLQNIQRSGENLNRRVDELLDLARAEIGTLRISPCLFQPLDILKDIAADKKPEAAKRNITFYARFPETLPEIYADEDRIRQVVRYLVDNAFRFTDDGGMVILEARVDNNELLIEVQDNGRGLTDDEQELLFYPYDRAEVDRQRLSGLGLGLALSKSLVELHGGRIWVDSTRDEGSTFGIALPLGIPKDIRPD